MSNPTESKLIELPKAHELKGKGDGLRVLQNGSDITRFQACYIDIDSDETYACFNSKHPIHLNDPKQTQNRPNTHPIHKTQHTDISGLKRLKMSIIENIENEGKIKPKSFFIDTKKRVELSLWNKAINELKRDEIILFKNGVGYFLIAEYNTALDIIEGS
jgi:hypothetical protein